MIKKLENEMNTMKNLEANFESALISKGAGDKGNSYSTGWCKANQREKRSQTSSKKLRLDSCIKLSKWLKKKCLDWSYQ